MEKYTIQLAPRLPVVPLRGLVVLPGELLHFDAGRPESRRALTVATEGDGIILAVTQKDAKKNDVTAEDLYSVGTICRVRQTISLPGDTTRVLVQGLCRGKADDIAEDEYMTAAVKAVAEPPCEDDALAEALRRKLASALSDYASLTTRINADAVENITRITECGPLSDAVANAVITKAELRQRILETADITERMKLVLAAVLAEIEIQRINHRIQLEVKQAMDKNQKEYYLREQIKAIKKELGDTDDEDADKYEEQLRAKHMPEEIKKSMEREITRFRDLPAGSHEQPQMRNYIECMLELPWDEETQDDLDIVHARKVLDDEHYGLEKVKERIIEHIAVARLTGKVNGQILCLVGPPGVGKTSVAGSVAHALGRNFVRMSLGGIHDEAEIRGHRRTYIGAMPGRVIAAMRRAGSVNPVILFDEIDKLASDMRGDPASAMLEVLDSAQNFAFRDHFLEVDYDLSKVMFIVTANTTDTIPAPLLDRMEIIELPGYMEYEKLEIAKRHLLPKQMEKHGLTRSMLSVNDAAITSLIRGYTREAGVRELERELASVCRKAACELGEGKSRVRVTPAKIADYLGIKRYDDTTVEKENAVGMVNGLAWTSFGGDVLEIEAQVVPGSGQVILTGKLGEVMQESARAALTYIKAHANELDIDAGTLDKRDIHLHVPEGAVPKDGPSAGVTIMTAMTSAITGIPARADVAMTGEITLRGRVLPIGGLREKLLAANRAGIAHVLVPGENRKDMEEVPEQIKDATDVRFITNATDALSYTLERMPGSGAHGAPSFLPAESAGRAGAVQ